MKIRRFILLVCKHGSNIIPLETNDTENKQVSPNVLQELRVFINLNNGSVTVKKPKTEQHPFSIIKFIGNPIKVSGPIKAFYCRRFYTSSAFTSTMFGRDCPVTVLKYGLMLK